MYGKMKQARTQNNVPRHPVDAMFLNSSAQLLSIRTQTMAFGVLTKQHWSLAVWNTGCQWRLSQWLPTMACG